MVAIVLDKVAVLTTHTNSLRDQYGRSIVSPGRVRKLWAKTIAIDDRTALEPEGARYTQDVRVVVRYDAGILAEARDGGYGGWTLEIEGYQYLPVAIEELPEYRREYMAVRAVRGS